ncbi:MAG: formyltetrahydrofolate deformylase [Nesterenkonia sp.]
MNTEQRPDIARLIIACPDQHGIVAAVSDLIAELGGNIITLDQYSTGVEGGQFFQRTVFHLPQLAARRTEVEQLIDSRLAARFSMEWQLTDASRPKRVAIFASKTDHCLLDLLWRHRRGDLPMQIACVISNHRDLEEDVRRFGVEFVHVPVDKANKVAAEAEHLDLLKDNVDLVVLARYMQILSPEFLEQVGVPVMNIHHSFLPAFIGAGPYQKAKDRGVKLIGATAHYVTEDLDEGPIIEQDVIRVSHADDVAQLTRYGADVERAVLSRAVKWHCEDRVIRHGKTTIVF